MPDAPATATLLLVDDVPANLRVLSEALEGEGHHLVVAIDGADAVDAARQMRPDLILMDVEMPGVDGFEACRRLQQDPELAGIPVIFVTVRDEPESLAEGFRAGGVDYVSKPIAPEEVVARVRCHLQIRRLQADLETRNRELEAANVELRRQVEARTAAERATEEVSHRLETIWNAEAGRWQAAGFVGDSEGMRRVVDDIGRISRADQIGVLILGETGTGKELVARAIHYASPRRRGPFVAVNCSAIPAQLTESVFFGHVKGAFTGATANHAGHFAQAAGGTLFLDEIGDMPVDLQAHLLRVLENGEFTPVGATGAEAADVRIVAATNADLPQRMAAGGFREDLYYRLARFRIPLPPLRERRGDIPLLATHFLEAAGRDLDRPGVVLSAAAQARLVDYPFPGNVRELRNLIEHALILCDGDIIQPEHLSLTEDAAARLPAPAAADSGGDDDPVAARALLLERAHGDADPQEADEERILGHLREHGTITNGQCRELLGIDRNRAFYLLSKLQRYGLIERAGEGRRWQRYRLV